MCALLNIIIETKNLFDTIVTKHKKDLYKIRILDDHYILT